jgi:hypothetical protein
MIYLKFKTVNFRKGVAMRTRKEKIMVISPKDIIKILATILKAFPSIEMTISDSKNEAGPPFILDHDFFLIIVNDAVLSMDPYDTARMLLNHNQAEN